MKKEERRFSGVSLRMEGATAEDSGKIVGYAAVFGRSSVDLGGFTEEIAPGAFRKAIEEDDIRALVDHDSSRIVGRLSAGTLRLSEDEVGLRMEIDLPNTTVGRDLRESVERGDITGASFGFQTVSDEWRMQDGEHHRVLKDVRLFDVGPVTFPAYPDTEVATRSLSEWRAKNEPAPAPPVERDSEYFANLQRLAEASLN